MISLVSSSINLCRLFSSFPFQKPLMCHCGHIARLYKSVIPKTACQGLLQMQLLDFPGGADVFELAARFCYCHGRMAITPFNVSKLRCAGEYLEMTENYREGNLIAITEMFLKDMMFWDWDDILNAFKECQDVFFLAEKTHVVERCVEALTIKIISTLSDYSPFSSSPDSVPYGVSRCNTWKRSSKHVSKTWWFSDLSILPISLMERVLKGLQMRNVDNKMLARFLLHYLRFSLPILSYSRVSVRKKSNQNEETLHDYRAKMQQQVLEKVVALLTSLERTSASCKSLFSLLRVSIALNASKLCGKQLERMIGSQLNTAILDNILIPSEPPRCSSLYDVDLVLRLVGYFLKERQTLPSTSVSESQITVTCSTKSSSPLQSPLTKVGRLMDKYIAEVAPDANLKPHKFQALTQSLPNCARPTHDGLYLAVDIYLEVCTKVIVVNFLDFLYLSDV
ncbi:hypothetical protein O6H91_08G046300 [Diphasiastrum complanatum]|uniref:Uncharacterized protein n=1 Tax=Diphasiastrum complanatum TaxID=34168 RepID=A0ACC2CY51_DIPCM|nr:hypothetical protein O6H91_08G046300 [Diphasiastrum complanatum]